MSEKKNPIQIVREPAKIQNDYNQHCFQLGNAFMQAELYKEESDKVRDKVDSLIAKLKEINLEYRDALEHQKQKEEQKAPEPTPAA